MPVDEALRDGRREMDGELSAFCFEEWPKLVAVLSLYCGDRDLAEDVAQEALLRVCVHWTTVVRADAPDRWLYRVAFNLAKSHWRRRKVARRIEARTRRSAASPVDDADAADADSGAIGCGGAPRASTTGRRAAVLRRLVRRRSRPVHGLSRRDREDPDQPRDRDTEAPRPGGAPAPNPTGDVMVSDLHQTLERGATPPSDPVPDVDRLWQQAQRRQRRRAAVTVGTIGTAVVAIVVAAASRVGESGGEDDTGTDLTCQGWVR